ncbi:MAG: thiamine diphosphokinase [Clostridia bacterium]|nr:thiamine diphosphokinase [Clostridia bacterium]
MKRWIILGAAKINDYAAIKPKIAEDDFIVCADGGQKHLEPLGLKADLYLGDFDSSKKPEIDAEILTYPVEKDDTDTMLAVKEGIKRGCKSFVIFGGMGGRFDHTFANIQTLIYADKKGATAVLADENNMAFVLRNDKAYIERNVHEKVSFFPLNGPAHGVTMEGFYYEVDNVSLYPHDTLGTSNFVIAPQGKVTVKKGMLLAIISKENQ